MVISKVFIAPEALEYIEKRELTKQYQKAKSHILSGRFSSAQLKLRAPKKDQIWYFRINKKFRALCELDGEALYVYAIDDHQ